MTAGQEEAQGGAATLRRGALYPRAPHPPTLAARETDELFAARKGALERQLLEPPRRPEDDEPVVHPAARRGRARRRDPRPARRRRPVPPSLQHPAPRGRLRADPFSGSRDWTPGSGSSTKSRGSAHRTSPARCSYTRPGQEALSLGHAFTYAASGGSVSSAFRLPDVRRPFCIVRIKVFNSSAPGSGCRVGLLITRQPLELMCLVK